MRNSFCMLLLGCLLGVQQPVIGNGTTTITLTGGEETSVPVIDTLTLDGAWCWFADPRAIYYEGAKKQTYFSWITTAGDIMIASYNHETGEYLQKCMWEKFQPDDHANPSLLIRDDGRIIIFFAAHFGDKISRYISTNPEDITSWSQNYQFSNTVTYPYPFQVGDSICVFYRGGSDWHPRLSVSTDNGQTFDEGKLFVAGGGQRPYTRYFQGSDGSIHVAVTTGHPRNESANKIYYCRYKNNNFYRANGTLIKNFTTSGAVNISELEVVYNASAGKGWIWDIALDPQTGYPMMLYAAFPSDTDHRYRYAYWNGTQWNNSEITAAGKWFPQTPAGTTEPEPNYSGGLIFDSDNPSVVYLSKQVNGIFEIFQYTTTDHGTSWTSEAITSNTPAGIVNVRPIVPRHHKSGYFDVIWMRGTYTYYADLGYHTSLVYKRSVTVDDVERVVLNETSVRLLPGKGIQLSATFLPFLASDKNLTWESSDESVATVVNGYVLGQSEGDALITAKSANGVFAVCEVMVSAPTYIENALFDFGTATSPVAAGAIGIHDATPVNDSYGWMGAITTRDRGTSQNDEERDFNMAGDEIVFRVYVTNGDYHTTIKQGDKDYFHDAMTVKINGVTKLQNITAAKGAMLTNSFDVTVTDKKLDFAFSRNGTDPNWIVNSIKIEQTSRATSIDSKTIDSDEFNQPVEAISISDTSGRVLFRHSSGRITAEQFLSENSLAQGVYLITCVSDNKKRTFKYIKR
ncbi:MAG: Beta-agarase A [Candidatus Ordinivivax streblomastigis]|uniref:Beta-agarase A n=1 Tax=Candidatus Ordinivivax streblomastigis TaxID=2540710 RepID=A0A5M8P301_9BACT|nr:MAG: Beta-agarase A [Candidatus Ordinivivax streblomastigis]